MQMQHTGDRSSQFSAPPTVPDLLLKLSCRSASSIHLCPIVSSAYGPPNLASHLVSHFLFSSNWNTFQVPLKKLKHIVHTIMLTLPLLVLKTLPAQRALICFNKEKSVWLDKFLFPLMSRKFHILSVSNWNLMELNRSGAFSQCSHYESWRQSRPDLKGTKADWPRWSQPSYWGGLKEI